MKKKIHFLPLIGALLLMQITFAQKITLPYQEVGGVPIVKVNINDKTHDFIFDTGAPRTVIDKTLSKNLEIIDSSSGYGANGIQGQLKTTRLNYLTIDEQKFDALKVGVANLDPIRKRLCGIHLGGILGTDIMEGYIVEIDSKHHLIKFYNPETFEQKKLEGFTKFNYWHEPRIKLNVNGKNHLFIFDTGGAQGLNIAAKNKILAYVKEHPHTTTYTTGGIGVFGQNQYIAKSYKVDTLNIKFGGWFNHIFLPSSPVSINTDASMNNMGFQYIKQFHVFLDQNKYKLYLKPYPQNGQENYIDPLLKYGFDLGFDFDSNQFYVNARTGSNDQLKMGDIVLTINGAALPKEKCGLEAFKKKNFSQAMKMTILRDGKETVIDYRVPDKLTARF